MENTGWICPICGSEVHPNINNCPCKIHPPTPWYPPTQPYYPNWHVTTTDYISNPSVATATGGCAGSSNKLAKGITY